MQNKSSFPSLLFCTSLNLNKFLTLTKVKTVFLLLRLTKILQYLCTDKERFLWITDRQHLNLEQSR